MNRINQRNNINLNNDQGQLMYEQIIKKIQNLDNQNNKLVSIADNIMKTSFLRPHDNIPTVILQLQEEMRISFNALIESVRQFFINIDQKIKQIGLIVGANIGDLDSNKSKSKGIFDPDDKFNQINHRIALIQDNLKKTQQNQCRLITIIQQLSSKNKYDQQPTISKSSQKPKHINNYKQTVQPVIQQSNSFRIFSVNKSTQTINNQRYPYNNYNLIQSQGSNYNQNNIKSNMLQPYHNAPIYLNKQPTSNNFCIPRVSGTIKQTFQKNKIQQMENSNRIHRLSNLMKALKQ